MTPYPGGHYYTHSQHRRTSSSRSRTPLHHDENRDPWDAALGVPLEQRSPFASTNDLEGAVSSTAIPTISHTPASPGGSDTETETEVFVPLTRRKRVFRAIGHVYHVLFPTLHNFRSKSFLGMIAAVFAAPAVMALTLTLPVVVTSHDDHHSHEEKLDNVGRLVDFEEEGVERALIAEEEVEEEIHELKFNKWLMAVQCAISPMFCVAILFGELNASAHHPQLVLLPVCRRFSA